MFEPNEIVLVLLGLVTFAFVWISANLERKKRPIALMLLAFHFEMISWISSNLETVFWYDFLNIVEHVFALAASLTLCLVAYLMFVKSENVP